MRRLVDKLRSVLRSPRKEVENGFILVVVISTLGVLALVAASFAQITNSHVRAAATAVQGAGAEALADAGVQLAILDLVANRQAGSQRRRFPPDSEPRACEAADGGHISITVQDEAGKVDLNMADERLVRALMAGAGIAGSASVTDALLDFRDADSDRRFHGAERSDYVAAGRTDGPKNAPLRVIEELEQVLGLDAASVALLRPFVTVYSGQQGIDAGSASPALIALLWRGHGFAPTAIKKDGEIGVVTAGETSELEQDQPPRRLPPGFAGGTGRRFFSVRAEAKAGRAVFVREAIVEMGGSQAQPFTLHRWYRGSLAGPRPADTAGLPPC